MIASGATAAASSGSVSGGTRITCSPLSRSGRLLVSRNLTFGHKARSPLHQIADRGQQLLTVVHHQQGRAVGKIVGQRVDPPRSIRSLQTQRLRDRREYELGLRDVSQRHHPAAITEASPLQVNDLQGDPGLPHPTRSHQCDHPR